MFQHQLEEVEWVVEEKGRLTVRRLALGKGKGQR
jgi:hypothetical protein